MHTTRYLYDINPQSIANIPYKQAIKLKINNAKLLLSLLLREHYSTRDDERISAVHKAIKFNEQLLNELEK